MNIDSVIFDLKESFNDLCHVIKSLKESNEELDKRLRKLENTKNNISGNN